MNAENISLTAPSSFSDVAKISTLASVVVASLLGIPPNLLSILLILRAKQSKSTTTCFLLNLAIADVTNLVASLMAGIFLFTEHSWYAMDSGDTVGTIDLMPKAVANVTLALIALERYNGLVKTMAPFVNIGKGKVKIIVGVTWSVCIGYYMSTFAYRVMNNGGTTIFVAFFYVNCIATSYVLPLVVVGYCYGKILRGTYHQGGTILVQNAANEMATKEKKRFVRIMVVVAVVFMACNLPAIVVKILMITDNHVSVGDGFASMLMLLGCVSSVVNPYIYGLHSERYRKQVKRLLRCERSERTALTDCAEPC